MKKYWMIAFLLPIWGCASATVSEPIVKTELKYKHILVMPFTQGTPSERGLAFNHFHETLMQNKEIILTPKEKLNPEYLNSLDIAGTYSVIDFSINEKGQNRRLKIRDTAQADAIILGSLLTEKNILSLYIQMIDVETGELSLSFSKVAEINDNLEESIKDLTHSAADKVINHLKENIIITTIHKY